MEVVAMASRRGPRRRNGYWLGHHRKRAMVAVRRAMPGPGPTSPISDLGKRDAERVRKALNTEFDGHRGFPIVKTRWEKIRCSLDSARALAVYAIAPQSFGDHPSSYTNRTLAAVADWCDRPVSEVTLSSKLDDLYPDGYSNLRRSLNYEFDGETGFPIGTAEWQLLQKKLTDVADVRDEVVRRAEG